MRRVAIRYTRTVSKLLRYVAMLWTRLFDELERVSDRHPVLTMIVVLLIILACALLAFAVIAPGGG